MISAQEIHQANAAYVPEKSVRAPMITRFKSFSVSYRRKLLSLWTLLFLEIALLISALSFFSGAAPIALIIAALFSTTFALFMLRMHWSVEKLLVWRDLTQEFADEFFESSGNSGTEPKERLFLSNAYVKVAGLLEGQESYFFSLPRILAPFSSYATKFSIYWHSFDLLRMREALLEAAAGELVELIKLEPLNLDLHAALANAYVLIATLFQKAQKPSEEDPTRFLLTEELREEFTERYESCSKRAIEEFKILSAYMPKEPWVHKQLALSYRDMNMPEEEKLEYEILRELTPEDPDTLYKLGKLYFIQGLHAQGLEAYQELLGIDYSRAENLLEFYGI